MTIIIGLGIVGLHCVRMSSTDRWAASGEFPAFILAVGKPYVIGEREMAQPLPAKGG